jgi:glycosyltransferase involved in cell wall biosynthesis
MPAVHSGPRQIDAPRTGADERTGRQMDQKISVIIPTADRPEALAHALESLRAQRRGGTIQAVVVNDGGADVADVVAPFSDDLQVKLLTQDGNRGPSAARNLGLDAAEGDFVTFLDDDDVLLPGHFDAVLPIIEAGGADVVYTTMMVSAERREPTVEGYRDALPAFDYDFDPEFLLMANYIPPLGLTMRRTGPDGPRFDTGVRLAEEWDLWLRMVADGYRFHHVDVRTAVYHRLPRHDHKSDPPASESVAIHAFLESYRNLCGRWAVKPDSPAALGRSFVERAYELAFIRLDQHRRLVSPFWWESMLRVLHEHLAGRLPDADVDAALSKAVSG